MALAAIKTWTQEKLFAADLNAEFANIRDNALSLVSPWTGSMAAGGFSLTGLALGSVTAPTLSLTGDSNTGIYSSAADVVDITAGGVRAASFITATTGVNYFKFTPSAAGAVIQLDAEGTDTNIGVNIDTKGTGSLLFRRAGGTTEMGRMASDILLWGTTVATGATAGDIVLAESSAFRFLNSTSTSADSYIRGGSNGIKYSTSTAGGLHLFQHAGTDAFQIQFENSGAGILFINESSSDHAAPAANRAVIYLKDNGSGKTQIAARFATGAVQIMATQP